MAFDGSTVAALRAEIEAAIGGGYIAKITQSEPDEILLAVKKDRGQVRLLLSANPSLPLAYLTDESRPAPASAPNFCMFLRKYIGGGHILSVDQPGLERALRITIQRRNELGDLRDYCLILELMGKHSNLILCDSGGQILDAIKHISFRTSSVREVLPGREYFLPNTGDKKDPLTIPESEFCSLLSGGSAPVVKTLYSSLTGISPLVAEELCLRARLDAAVPACELTGEQKNALFAAFSAYMDDVKAGCFRAQIYYENGLPAEFSAIPLTLYADSETRDCGGISEAVRLYYSEREKTGRIRQRSGDLRRAVTSAIERVSRKLDLQQKQMRDTEKRDRYRVYGELLNTYGYELSGKESSFTTTNFYDNSEITIPLDPELSARENAVRYFDRYNKLKRTAEQLVEHIDKSERDLAHLESILSSLDLAESEDDLAQIRKELGAFGYVRAKAGTKKGPRRAEAKPLHYRSSAGYDIYVGKNNYQNEEVTFRIAEGSDWWFHAKGLPGSHVVVKTRGDELPDAVFEEAGRLAAYYSKARLAPKVEIDYTLRKNLKKTTGGPPGFVIYHTNYSLMAEPDISGIKQL